MAPSLQYALTSAAILSLISGVFAAPSGPGVIGFDFEKRHYAAGEGPKRLRKRASSFSADIGNYLELYLINATVGTPPQAPFQLQLDTGSSDIWFPATNSDLCQQDAQACVFGTYDSSKSTSFKNLTGAPPFQIQYVDGTQITGSYITDVLQIGSTKLTNATMASATTLSRDVGIGIMGVGYQSGEAGSELEGFTYPSVIQVMKNEGVINSLGYSLWLNDLESDTGSILFGGVDTDKYHGDLIAVPVQNDAQTGNLTSFTVAWTGLTISGGGQVSKLSPSTPQPAVLDCGTTDLILPDDIANSIFNGVGVITDENYGNVIPCSVGGDDLTFSFQFGGSSGPVINVSVSEFVVPIETQSGQEPTFQDGTPACQFAIDAAGGDPTLFGDTFLRSAYVVYDLQNNMIGLANTNFNSTTSNVKAFNSDGSIPGVSSTAGSVTVSQTFTGIPLETASEGQSGNLAGTSRSPTFRLVAATATASNAGSTRSGSSGSTASGSGGSTASATGSGHTGAASPLQVPAFGRTTIAAGLVALVGLVFGGSLILG